MAKQVAPVAVDDWEVLGSATPRCREGLFVSISPGGAVRFARDLSAKLDPKTPRCTMKYSISQSKLRLFFQREITANSHSCRSEKGSAGFGAESALRAKNLLPEKVTLYEASYIEAKDGQPAYVEVDMTKVLLVVEPHPRKQTKPPAEPETEDKPLPTMAKCAECGTLAVKGPSLSGRVALLRPHNDSNGRPCFCRRPVL